MTNIKMTTLIPGRAIFLSIPQQYDETLHLINIYAPNNQSQHEQFWSQVSSQWLTKRLPSPHMMTSDSNMVEDPLD